MALVQLALDIGDADNDGKIPPYVGCRQLEGLSDEVGSRRARAGDLATQGLFSLEAIKVLREGSATRPEVVPLDDQHRQGVEFVEGVEYAQQVPRVSLRRDCEEVAQRWSQQAVELLFRDDLEERRLVVIKGAAEGSDELHLGQPTADSGSVSYSVRRRLRRRNVHQPGELFVWRLMVGRWRVCGCMRRLPLVLNACEVLCSSTRSRALGRKHINGGSLLRWQESAPDELSLGKPVHH